jgi:hypothetical protein
MLPEFKTHFVKVTATGLFLSRSSPAMAGDTWSNSTIALANVATRL